MKPNFKINREKFLDSLTYINVINHWDFDNLDWSEFPKYKDISKEEIKRFQMIGLNNTDFFWEFLRENGEVNGISE